MNKVVKLKPCVKSYLWGGQYFQKYHKSDLDIVSELWELSTRDESSSLIDSGINKDKRLSDVITKEDLGPNALKYPYFPLLIKLIDAKDDLSIQVHPSDEYALKNEHSFGKSEMWHIIDADEGCGIYVGFNKDYTKEEIEKRLKDNTILETLNFFNVKKGDTYLINPGTIHAIGKGVRLIEIQQNSDLTYRLYDYLRKDKDGNYRELHIEKALHVINYQKYEKPVLKGDLLADNEYFHVERKEINGELLIKANQGSFVSFTFIEGEGVVDDITANRFDTFFLPNKKECLIKGKGTIIISRV
ncbi:MAG: class I mannose-6-phosphate isomerase [Bacilli bacterium]|nr:class I mannose-6-phosphate isomerase [Bacilli bacterium]